MVVAFPAAKLGALLIKQVSKPIANFAKARAKSSPIFRKYICMPPAQIYHWCEVQLKMWVLNLGKPVNIPVLSEAMAIELGASLLGEGIIFSMAAAILIFEYQRSSRKEEKKEYDLKAEKEAMNNTIQELYFLTQKQETQIRELTRMIYDLEGRVIQKPWTSKSSKDELPPSKPPPSSFSGQGMNPPEIDSTDKKYIVLEELSNMKETPDNSLILSAASTIQQEFWSSPNCEEEKPLLTIAVNYILKDICKFKTLAV